MIVTECRVTPVGDSESGRLRAYASLILDGRLAIHDLKVVEGKHGQFIDMPSRRRHVRCPDCEARCSVTDRYCHACGAFLDPPEHPDRPFVSVVHPLDANFRQYLTDFILKEHQRCLSNLSDREDTSTSRPSNSSSNR